MIRTQVNVHDKFSIEFKTGFLTDNKEKDLNEFKINTWIFVPNGLDINRATYTKEQFYRDIKRNIRLITPVYSLSEIVSEGRGPFVRLEKALLAIDSDPDNEEKTENFLYQIKMLLSIVKSALRREAEFIVRYQDNEAQTLHDSDQYISNILKIMELYREKLQILMKDHITEIHKNYYSFGDNFLGNIVEQSLYFILNRMKNNAVYENIKSNFTNVISSEIRYREEHGYLVLEKGNEEKNSLVISQRNLLKKFIESDLFLRIVKKKDGAIAEQVYYSLAAGLAMAVATIISYFATLRYGSYTMGLSILLIIGYMLKDRVKDLARYYFLSGMSKKYFDAKFKLHIRNQEIGWIKESFDFVGKNKVSEGVLSMIKKSPLLEAETKIYNEQIILYRKWVTLSKEDIEKYKEYRLSGINDITRYNLLNFTQKMDNPSIPLYMLDENSNLDKFEGTRVYSLFFIIQCQSDSDEYYKSYIVYFNRNGITNVDEVDTEAR